MLAGSFLGAVATVGLGWALIDLSGSTDDPGSRVRLRARFTPLADALARTSYDLLFVLREDLPPPNGCLIYIDETSARALGQTPDGWDRSLHARLVRMLAEQRALAIVFDIVFAGPGSDPAVDEDFAAAIRSHGRVYLGGALELDESVGYSAEGHRVMQERAIPPTAVLRRAAAGWGLLAFRPVDPDYGVRRLYTGLEKVPTAAWKAASDLGAKLPEAFEVRQQPRWLNYYGRADYFPSISFDRALAVDGPKEIFRDRIVVIGGRSTLGGLRLGKDDFRGPYGLVGGSFFKGPEVHLTALMNLLRDEWLTRLIPKFELGLVIGFGILLGAGLPWARPHAAVLIALGASVGVAALAFWLFLEHRVWFAWGVPAFIQAPVALVWAVGSRYFIEERRQRALRDAFSHYLSPQMADRIADADFDLSLGGAVVEATVMFTDLENFTGLAEELDDPDRVAKVLTTYFTETTHHILENDGTILKYLGDSVQAVWGAPLPDENQARKAVRAALLLHEAGRMEVLGHPLQTRIGVNSGRVLAGNLGSAQRFDYATTGDAVNFASRLEGLNKYLGTSILISDTVEAQLGEGFILRCVGEFRVAGKKSARVIHEVIGDDAASGVGLKTFARGLRAFCGQDFDEAEKLFRETIVERNHDGPATFYLAQIARLRHLHLPSEWCGVIELADK